MISSEGADCSVTPRDWLRLCRSAFDLARILRWKVPDFCIATKAVHYIARGSIFTSQPLHALQLLRTAEQARQGTDTRGLHVELHMCLGTNL